MVKKGVLVTNLQKGRFGEIIIRDHFKHHDSNADLLSRRVTVNAIDLAGENSHSPCDGICPNGMYYDVKSSGLHIGGYWKFGTNNKYKDKIEIYYFLAFNEDYKTNTGKLLSLDRR